MASTTKTFLKVALPTPLRRLFDYLPPKQRDHPPLKPGQRLIVPFGKKKIVGVLVEVTGTTDVPSNKLKCVAEIIDLDPIIPKTLLNLLIWGSDYYHHSLGDVIANALPKLLREGRILEPSCEEICFSPEEAQEESMQLNDAQKRAVTQIKASSKKFGVFLLDGVTGSGKTEVYLQVIADVIAQGKQALLLVPEIGLTPQTVRRFQRRFPVKIAVLHSKLADKKRAQAWLAAKAGEAVIIIGTRSSIFTPLANVGIIILDEEHDLSFKQHSGFRYSARDLAVVRGQMEDVPVVLGSATPSLESLANR